MAGFTEAVGRIPARGNLVRTDFLSQAVGRIPARGNLVAADIPTQAVGRILVPTSSSIRPHTARSTPIWNG
jgi:hypothetical protein